MSHLAPPAGTFEGAPSRSSCSFGENDVAAERLRHQAEAFAPSSLAFLARLAREPIRSAVDLGCGPGYTTALLQEVTRAPAIVGLDSSARLLARARRLAPRRLVFAQHDVTAAPFPAPPADLIYGRFIVARLAEAGRAVANWARAAVPRGRLALEETALSPEDVAELGRRAGWIVESAELLAVALPGAAPAQIAQVILRNPSR